MEMDVRCDTNRIGVVDRSAHTLAIDLSRSVCVCVFMCARIGMEWRNEEGAAVQIV